MRLWDSNGLTFVGGFVFTAVCALVIGLATENLLITAGGFLVVGLALGLIDNAIRRQRTPKKR